MVLKALNFYLPKKVKKKLRYKVAHSLFRNMSVKQQKKQLQVDKGCLWRLESKEGRGGAGDRCFSL